MRNKIRKVLKVLCGGAFCKKECTKQDARCNLMEGIINEIMELFKGKKK